MKCKNCGKMFKISGMGRKPQFCSTKCRVEYNRNKKRFGKINEEESDKVRVEKKKIIVPVTQSVNAEIGRDDFERMMDGTVEQELRFVKDVLHKAMVSADTPTSALAGIGRELINTARQLDDITHTDNDPLIFEEETIDDDSFTFDTSVI